ncbi:hypothetical protein AUT26_08220 [[Arthrobacter] sp. ATCC 21022]|nr:hypothetical protein AUT26_08220 [Arthrobacter sp. ATCC 21022]KUR63418.1 hypothetical protein JM67_16815 [Arthrobacter sp. ATCC 21022]
MPAARIRVEFLIATTRISPMDVSLIPAAFFTLTTGVGPSALQDHEELLISFTASPNSLALACTALSPETTVHVGPNSVAASLRWPSSVLATTKGSALPRLAYRSTSFVSPTGTDAITSVSSARTLAVVGHSRCFSSSMSGNPSASWSTSLGMRQCCLKKSLPRCSRLTTDRALLSITYTYP